MFAVCTYDSGITVIIWLASSFLTRQMIFICSFSLSYFPVDGNGGVVVSCIRCTSFFTSQSFYLISGFVLFHSVLRFLPDRPCIELDPSLNPSLDYLRHKQQEARPERRYLCASRNYRYEWTSYTCSASSRYCFPKLNG